MAFTGASGFSIEGGAHNCVQGNQIISNSTWVIPQQEKERTVYDEFPDIRRGLIYRLRDLHHEGSFVRWNSKLQEYEVEFRVERTISIAEIYGYNSRFTVVSYKGQDATKAWKRDFQRFCETTDTTNIQLFGLNQSGNPLLIFYGELVPLAHFWDRIGWWGRSYAMTLVWNLECKESEMWIDPKQGTLIRGLEGPSRKRPHFGFLYVSALPSSVELLQDDVCLRYLSRLPLDKAIDRGVVFVLHRTTHVKEEIPPTTNHPYVLSSLSNSIIAVGSGTWIDLRTRLDSGIVRPDGRTRFNLTDHQDSSFLLHSNPFDHKRAWLSQALSVYHELRISSDEDLSHFELITPVILLRGSVKDSKVKRQRRSEGPPIYFFLHSLHPSSLVKAGATVSIHTWSFDKNGRTSIPRDYCKYLGLPTKLWVQLSRNYKYSWPTETYENIKKWQVARGFDPTTTNFARHLGYPMLEVMPSGLARFEELTPLVELSGIPNGTESSHTTISSI